jgi:hypothetical protein
MQKYADEAFKLNQSNCVDSAYSSFVASAKKRIGDWDMGTVNFRLRDS